MGARCGAGFTLLELVVVVCVVALLGLAAIDRLLYLREQAEKAMLEQNIQMLKTALRFQVAAAVAADRPAEIAALAGKNPVDWLEEPMAGYQGELAAPPACRGCWYFDTNRRELLYLVDRGDYFAPDAWGEKRVRMRVEVVLPQVSGADAVKTPMPLARLVVEPYRWFGGAHAPLPPRLPGNRAG
jgi:type II secretory pathway pseudopilin PulG